MPSLPKAFINLLLVMMLSMKSVQSSHLKMFCNGLADGNYLCPYQSFPEVCACHNQHICDTGLWYDPKAKRCDLNQYILTRFIKCLEENPSDLKDVTEATVRPTTDSSSHSCCSYDIFEAQLKELKKSMRELTEAILYIQELLAGKAATCSSPIYTTVATAATTADTDDMTVGSSDVAANGTDFETTDTTTAGRLVPFDVTILKPTETIFVFTMPADSTEQSTATPAETTFLPTATPAEDTVLPTVTPAETTFLQTATPAETTFLAYETATESTTISPEEIDACPFGFVSLNGTEGCYQIIPQQMTWEQSRVECQQLDSNSHLVHVNDSAQNDAIISYIKQFFRGTGQCNVPFSSMSATTDDDGFFTSGQRKISDNCDSPFLWKPTRESAFDMKFTDWDAEEPNCYGGYETCVQLRCHEDDCHWNDYGCQFQSCPICQIG